MKARFRLIRRGERSTFYCVDSQTGKRVSLQTKDRDTAEQIVLAKNQALRQATLNLHIAKAYLAGSNSGVATRTWQDALTALVETKNGPTRYRWTTAAKDKALDSVRNRIIIETQADDLLRVLKTGTVSTNVHLRKLHNFCLSMNWLPWPLIPKRLWPEIKYKPKRAITLEEHQRIIEREGNLERRDFYDLCWHLGGSQTDIAELMAEDIDWRNHTIAYTRKKSPSALAKTQQWARTFANTSNVRASSNTPTSRHSKQATLCDYFCASRTGCSATKSLPNGEIKTGRNSFSKRLLFSGDKNRFSFIFIFQKC